MITLDRPEALLLVPVGAAAIVWLGRGAPGGPQRIASIAARLLVLLLVAGALAGPTRISPEPLPRRLVAVLDLSDSTSDAERARALDLIESILAADPIADRRAVAFAGRASRIPWPTRPEDLAGSDLEPDATDLGLALATALTEADPDTFLRVVLATDGNATRGDANGPAAALRRAGARLDILALSGPEPVDVETGPRVLAIDAPREIDADAPASVRVLVDATDGDEVILSADGVEIARRRTGGEGESVVTFPSLALPAGTHRLTAAPVGAPDAGRSRAIRVRPGPRLRVVRTRPAPGPVEAALAASGLEAEIVEPDGLRATLAGLGPADLLLLETEGCLEPLVASLPELLGALRRGVSLILGAGAGLGAARETPLLPYLPVIPDAPTPEAPEESPPSPEASAGGVRLDTADKDAVRVALVLAVDTSGSMRGDKIAMARLAAYRAAETLDHEDTIGVLGFSEEPYWIVRPIAASNLPAIRHALARVSAAGGTDVYEALRESFRAIRGVEAGVRHVILLSDGHTPGSLFRTLVTGAATDKITLTTVGIGDGADLALLRKLSGWGRGAFRFAQTPADIPRIVTRDTQRILEEGRGEPLTPGGAPPEVDEPGPEPPPADETEPPGQAEPRAEPLTVAAPHPALAGIDGDAIPPLGGLTPCRARAATWVALETEADGRPVLAEWRIGLGRVLVLASDLEKPTARDWREWSDLPKLCIQAARALASASGPGAGPTISVRWTPSEVIVQAHPEPGGKAPTLRFVEAGLPAEASGEGVLPRGDVGRTVLVEAVAEGAATRARIVEVPPTVRLETATPGTDRRRLEALARIAGGRLDPAPETVPPSPERSRRDPVGFWLLLAACLLLPLDVAVRRIAWPGSRRFS